MVVRPSVRGASRHLVIAFALATALGGAVPAMGLHLLPTLATAGTVYAAEQLVPADLATSAELGMLELVNADRLANGLDVLELDLQLASVARWRSQDMAGAGYFSHNIGDVPGHLVFDVLRAEGVTYRVAGENLARTSGRADQTGGAEAALMASPTHRANILRPEFTHLGVGVAIALDGSVVYTQLFKSAW